MPLQIDVVTDVFAFQTNKIEAAVIYFPVCELPLPQILEECRMRHLHSDSRRCNEAVSVCDEFVKPFVSLLYVPIPF